MSVNLCLLACVPVCTCVYTCVSPLSIYLRVLAFPTLPYRCVCLPCGTLVPQTFCFFLCQCVPVLVDFPFCLPVYSVYNYARVSEWVKPVCLSAFSLQCICLSFCLSTKLIGHWDSDFKEGLSSTHVTGSLWSPLPAPPPVLHQPSSSLSPPQRSKVQIQQGHCLLVWQLNSHGSTLLTCPNWNPATNRVYTWHYWHYGTRRIVNLDLSIHNSDKACTTLYTCSSPLLRKRCVAKQYLTRQPKDLIEPWLLQETQSLTKLL